MSRNYGELPHIDPDKQQQSTAYLSPAEKALVASMASGNGSPESDVIKQGLELLAIFKNLGFTDRMHLPPLGNETEPTLVILHLDLSQGVTTMEDYQQLYEVQERGKE